MKPVILPIAVLGLAATAWLGAQISVDPAKDGMVRPFWSCSTPGGTFMVPLDRISNVSTHQYVVQGAGRVWEVVIADDSSSIARYYYMESASKLQNPATGEAASRYTEEALEKATEHTKTEKIWEKVVKSYPDATHAHTVEFRLAKQESLTTLFEHLRDNWQAGRHSILELDTEKD